MMQFIRKPYGKGFTYQDQEGKTITDTEMRKWFKSLAIPPAWSSVKISGDKRSDLLATGRDEKGRKQYIYNEAYLQKNAREKFNRIVRFAEKLDRMRSITEGHLEDSVLSKQKILATMVRLMDEAYFRPGCTNYTNRNGSFGLTTLRSRHLTIKDDFISFSYKGKSAQPQQKIVNDDQLIKILKDLDEVPGYRVFKYFDEKGIKQYIECQDLNEYIKEIMGEEFSAKDFRTWAGTLIAAIALDELDTIDINDQKKLDEAVRKVVVMVSEQLGNTPAVAKSSYIDPRIIEAFKAGKTLKSCKIAENNAFKCYKNLDAKELAVLYLLNKSLE